jgi:hypothetical protein
MTATSSTVRGCVWLVSGESKAFAGAFEMDVREAHSPCWFDLWFDYSERRELYYTRQRKGYTRMRAN